MNSIQYEPAIIREFASKLYAEANRVILLWAILLAVPGAGIGGAIGYLFLAGWEAEAAGGVLGGILGIGVLGGLGRSIGERKAFILKLQAQLALCQVAIEENSKKRAGTI